MTNLSQACDTQLITSFQNGEAQAIEILINRHKDKIFSSILFLTKDKYLAEDLFQEVFIKVIDTLKKNKYNDEGKFLPWALRIAHNLFVDHFRKTKRAIPVVTSDDRDVFDMVNIFEASADTKMIRLQNHDKIRTMLNLLPADQREVIVLRHYADMSFKDIATITNCSINTALGRMRYGLQHLRKMMHEKQVA